mmetsp:Transcript_4003/g.5797  ORF Transcript_4003/g.5797 Transcript_4003/m.5797 type:complete len:252 (-) Transcript_4003:115-870(-)
MDFECVYKQRCPCPTTVLDSSTKRRAATIQVCLGLLQFVHGDFQLALDLLIGVEGDRLALDCHKHEGRVDVELTHRITRSGHGARIDEELSTKIDDAVLVGVPRDEDVDTQSAGALAKGILVAPRHDLVAMDDTYSEGSDLGHTGFDKVHIVVDVPLDDLAVLTCDSSQLLLHCLGANVASANHHADFVCVKEFLELGRNVGLSSGCVEVTDKEHEASELRDRAHRCCYCWWCLLVDLLIVCVGCLAVAWC